MSKKNFPTRTDPINLPRRLREGLAEADGLLSKNKPQEALDLLQELDRKFPRQTDLLGLMANTYIELGNQHGYLYALYQLHNLTPNRAEIKLGLAGACLANGRVALALRTFRQFLKQWPHDERADDVQKTVPQLEQGLTEIMKQPRDCPKDPWTPTDGSYNIGRNLRGIRTSLNSQTTTLIPISFT